MPPERSKQLVYELDAWYRSHTMRQRDLASALQLRPQQLSEILSLRNNPTGEQILIIQDFLKDNPMSTRVFNPDRLRPTSSDDDDDDKPFLKLDTLPRTLHQSIEMLEAQNAELAELRAEVAQLKSKPTQLAPAPKPAVQFPAAAAAKSTTTMPLAPNPKSRLQQMKDQAASMPRGTGQRFNPEPPLSELSEVDKLRVELNNEPDQEKRWVIYRKIQTLEAELSGLQPQARLRGL